MGGTIGVNSELGWGSTFSFTGSFINQARQPFEAESVVATADRSGSADGPFCFGTIAQIGAGQPGVWDGSEAAAPNSRRVLLVEDNQVNRTVAFDQLTYLGYLVDVSCNGQEALDALSLRNYDVVLMDCGMPVMDGYTATAEIRKREGHTARTPIIAMTAHAMNGDQEKCLAAGMDGYLGKPVKRKALEGVLRSLFTSGTEAGAQPAAAMPAAKSSSHDGKIVDEVCLSDAASNPEKLCYLIELYVRHTGERLEELKAAIREGSANDVYEIAHKCLGSSRTCGMISIVPALTELQRMGKAGDLSGAEERLKAAEGAFLKLKPFLALYREKLKAQTDRS